MSVKVKDNTAQVKSQVHQKAGLALRFILDDVHKTSTPVTPRRLGDLRSNVLKQVLGLRGKILWRSDHAIYQENKRYRNYTTPGTGPHFAKDSVKAVSRRVGSHFRRAGL